MKKTFRNSALQSLRKISEATRVKSDQVIALRLGEWCDTLPSAHNLNCALFWGMGHEIRTAAIDEVLKSHEITRLYPRTEGRQMTFHAIPAGMEAANMQKGPFGIPQPPLDWPEATIESLDLVLVPAVGVTLQGQRLGQGGGFYDRLMAGCRAQAKPPPWSES